MAEVPKTARAALLVGFGRDLEIGEVRIPESLEPGSILVKNTVATVCASDVHMWEGDQSNPRTNFPRILGHEMTGRVVRPGPGVTHDSIGRPLREGDRIIWTHGFCGQCYYCVVEHQFALCSNHRMYMMASATEYPYLVGGFAEYGYVFPTSGRIVVPDEVPDELASAAACALRTMISSFDRLGPLDDRHSVAIQGAGPLGLFATAIARLKGAHEIVVIGGPPHRLEVARRWGATHVVDIDRIPAADERKQLIQQWTDGLGPDVVVEASGARSAMPEGLGLVRRGGRYLAVGQMHPDPVPIRPADIVGKHVTVIGNFSGTTEHYERALQLIKHHRHSIPWPDLISNRYPLEQINTALVGMKRWAEIKPAIIF
jgi:L-iditol 2-dehydrogenase